MDTNKRIVLVTGATGKSGGATARHLLSKGWQVRALTRDISNPAAQALRDSGAELIQGDFGDELSLKNALTGVYGTYSMQLPHDLDLEVEYGQRMADLAKSAGVKHFVYASVGGAERNTGIPHFESKRRIEEHIEVLDFPYTILRPAYFMENLYWKQRDILNGEFKSLGLDHDKPLQMIAADDIGAIAALAFENPEDYLDQAIEIAGDELTETEIAGKISKFLNIPVEVVPDPNPPRTEDLALMNTWFNDFGYDANIQNLRQVLPELQDFSAWLGNSQFRPS